MDLENEVEAGRGEVDEDGSEEVDEEGLYEEVGCFIAFSYTAHPF